MVTSYLDSEAISMDISKLEHPVVALEKAKKGGQQKDGTDTSTKGKATRAGNGTSIINADQQ
eukprot:5933057-Amphidinium_carterae.1